MRACGRAGRLLLELRKATHFEDEEMNPMDQPGTRMAGFACVAMSLVVGGVGLLLLSLLPSVSSLLETCQVPGQLLRAWGENFAAAGVVGLASVVSLASLEAWVRR